MSRPSRSVPLVPTWKNKHDSMLVTVTAPHSPAAEAYRALRTSVQFLAVDHPSAVVQFTSPSAKEGKTTTIANLGVALAEAGLRTVLVDADLRRPRLHKFFEIGNAVGFTSVLSGDAPLSRAIQPVAGNPLLAVLPSGPVPHDPSAMLASARAAELLRAVAEECDFVLVDSPPVLPVTDAAIVAGLVEGTVLVVSASFTTRRDTRRAVEQLAQVGAPIIGCVLNSLDLEAGYGYGYTYSYAASKDSRRGHTSGNGGSKVPRARTRDGSSTDM